jgi:antitoxin VapB
MTTAKVFMHGNSQAVRLPREFRVEGAEVEITRIGRVLVLRPKRFSYEDALSAVANFAGGIEREQDTDQERNWSPAIPSKKPVKRA